jgi:Apea-like HEPN
MAMWVSDVGRLFGADPPMTVQQVVKSVTSTGYETQDRPTMDVVALERMARRLKLASFDRVAALAISRPDLFRQVPERDEAGGTRAEFVAATVAEPILRAYLARVGGLRFDRSMFDAVFDQIERELMSPTTPYTAIAAVDNLDLPDGAVDLLPDVALRPRTDADLENWINHESATSERGRGYIGAVAVMERPYVEKTGEMLGARQSQDTVQRILTAIQLHANCDASDLFLHFRRDATFHSGIGGTIRGAPRFGRRRGALRREDVSAVTTLYDALGASPNRAACDLALDRWTSVVGGSRPQNLIVDCWVGLESLLFREESATSEIRYRASLRLAALIGTDAQNRKSVLASARKTYDGRSKILHGADTKKVDLPALATESRDYLRRGLIRVLTTAGPFDPNVIEEQLLAQGLDQPPPTDRP